MLNAIAAQSSQLFGRFEIDSSVSRASYGLKSNSAVTREFAQDAWQVSMQAIEKMAVEGDRMARIESKENAIAEMSTEYLLRDDRKEIVYKMIDRPTIKYHPSAGQFVDISA